MNKLCCTLATFRSNNNILVFQVSNFLNHHLSTTNELKFEQSYDYFLKVLKKNVSSPEHQMDYENRPKISRIYYLVHIISYNIFFQNIKNQ